jgi:prevent-host-death family protein
MRIPKIITVTELSQNSSQVVNEAATGEPIVVTQRGKPAVVIIAAETYQTQQEALAGAERKQPQTQTPDLTKLIGIFKASFPGEKIDFYRHTHLRASHPGPG